MGNTAGTRRWFLETTAGIVAALAATGFAGNAQPNSGPKTAGVVYGRVGSRGIAAGTASTPTLGEVILLDGTKVEAAHDCGRHIVTGKSVLLASDASGRWSVLYAEF
jgi:hypothetical protein